MPQADDPQSLLVPLFAALDAVGFGEHENIHHFNTGTLFWSLTRLFGCYERVMSSVELPREERHFLDADIENYIVRFRIVLNDIAYVTWQLLPGNARGLKGPRGLGVGIVLWVSVSDPLTSALSLFLEGRVMPNNSLRATRWSDPHVINNHAPARA